MADPMNRHTQIRQAVLARLREQCGDSATFFDGLPAFIDAQELPAVAVWLSDAQYTGKMTDEDDGQAVLHLSRIHIYSGAGMDRELKNLTLNISQLAALSGVHRQTAAARLQNLPVAGGHESNLKLYRVVDIVSAFLALPPPVAELSLIHI